jgi:hypothetical protein
MSRWRGRIYDPTVEFMMGEMTTGRRTFREATCRVAKYRVMGTEKNRFRFAPFGTGEVFGPANIDGLIGMCRGMGSSGRYRDPTEARSLPSRTLFSP